MRSKSQENRISVLHHFCQFLPNFA